MYFQPSTWFSSLHNSLFGSKVTPSEKRPLLEIESEEDDTEELLFTTKLEQPNAHTNKPLHVNETCLTDLEAEDASLEEREVSPSDDDLSTPLTCSTLSCACGLCCVVPALGTLAMVGGFALVFALENYLKEEFDNPDPTSFTFAACTALALTPCIAMFIGLGCGFALWGKCFNESVAWEQRQRSQQKSTSIGSFVYSLFGRKTSPTDIESFALDNRSFSEKFNR